ncbi:uncharacterized protein LTR77_010506 [Saxophila tyrrhenica]|uniref:Uncharacterized protein n=1 Tax=Saxophila tyrrhenica TaxID=1690608 RepID=A0AAV9NV82_9PEZI|nr:hypothetical protein LTR77_010506 [Saxophila tyrrhenica]
MLSCPKLSPLQSRFLASLATLALLGLIYWTIGHPPLAYAAELDFDGAGEPRGGEDHNWHRITQEALEEDGVDPEGDEGHTTPVLIARAPVVSSTGGNNIANNANIEAGNTSVWLFPVEQLQSRHADRGPGLPSYVEAVAQTNVAHGELRKRHDSEQDDTQDLDARQNARARTIYISMNTCLQPNYVGSGTQSAAPPQLTLYVATDESNENPGPQGSQGNQRAIPLDGGFAATSISVDDSWYMSVHAPSLPDNFTGVWNYELAVSIDDYFHSVSNDTDPNLFLLDSDSSAALLVTNNLTQADPSQQSFKDWMNLTAPYVVFASNVNDTRTMGLSKSFCGLNKNSQIAGAQDQSDGSATNVQMQMTTRGLGNKPKEQFYVTALNGSSTYFATLAQVGNSTSSGSGVVGGGGKVWQTTVFPTKSDGNCALLYNLDFCSEVAYAVPSTPDLVANYSRFQSLYDNFTLNYYHNFNYSLQQVPCHTTSDAQYSLARNCDDCAKAYKEWLCAVSIPRCEDFSSDAKWLQRRNMGQPFFNGTELPSSLLNQHYTPMSKAPTLEGTIAYSQTYISSVATNSSRNPMIDEVIQPGPYKEVLPCEDLCYSLVQSCPAALGFGCPFPGKGLEASYGSRHGNGNGTLTCSFLGAYVYTGGASSVGAGVMMSRAWRFGVQRGIGNVHGMGEQDFDMTWSVIILCTELAEHLVPDRPSAVGMEKNIEPFIEYNGKTTSSQNPQAVSASK